MLQTYEDFINKIDDIDRYIEQYEQAVGQCNAAKKEIQDYTKLRENLYAQYHKKLGMIIKTEKHYYSKEELDEIRRELADTKLSTLIKRFLGIGKKRDEIYGELMGKLDAVIDYMKDELSRYECNAEEILSELTRHGSEYESGYKQIKKAAGCLPESDWGFYQETDRVQGRLYLGDVFIPFESAIHYAGEYLKQTMVQSYSSGKVAVPYTSSLRDTIRFSYDCRRDTGLYGIQSIKSLVYQMIRMTPAYYMELHLMDGERTGADFAELMDLSKVREGELSQLNRKVTHGTYKMAQTYLKNQEITEGLRALEQRMIAVAEEMGGYNTLADYNAEHDSKNGKGLIPYQVLVIHHFPMGFTDEDVKLLDKLICNGERRGISVLILNNQDKWKEREKQYGYQTQKDQTFQDKLSKEANEILDRIRIEQEGSTLLASGVSAFCRLQLMHDSRPEYMNSVIAVKTSVQVVDNRFDKVMDLQAPYGQLDSAHGLHIPFAIDRKGNIIEYQLGEAMNAHGLICGGTGSGKSTLLHMLISSIVMNYRPDDVEIWLADYKITEFYTYKSNTPPHIRFIGLSKTSDFSYAFIDKITNEMNRRQEIIAEADYQLKAEGRKTNVTNFNEYRKIFGITSMRRLIVIVDEFHVMAQHAQQETVYKEKLENLLSEARALGIILLFSDQAIVDGLRGLSDKGKKQIKARLALSNSREELEETLGEKERDKIKPFLNMQRGEVAMQTYHKEKDEEGIEQDVPQIERAMVIYINGENRYEVNERARQQYGAKDYVADVFDDREVEAMNMEKIQNWEKTSLKVHRDGSKDLQIYLGRPVDLQFGLNFSLLQRKGNNIMSIAGDEEQQMRILNAVIGSFVRQKEYEILVATDPYASLYREYGSDIHDLAIGTGNMTIYEDLEDICYQINRLLHVMNDRGNQKKILVVWLGLDTIADLLSEESTRKPEALARMASNQEEASTNKGKIEQAIEKRTGNEKQDTLENLFHDLFGEEGDLEEEEEAETEMENLTEKSFLYNACEDITRILHLGPTRNVYNLVIYDTAAALKDFRGARTSDFNHKIAFAMSDNEASEFLDRSNLIRTLPEHMAYYYNGRMGKKFIPYKL